jgi:hypothetical protein
MANYQAARGSWQGKEQSKEGPKKFAMKKPKVSIVSSNPFFSAPFTD